MSKYAVRYVSLKVTVMFLDSGSEFPISPTLPTMMGSSDGRALFHDHGSVVPWLSEVFLNK